MANTEREFSIRDLVIALLRDQNIHTGYWGLTMHFDATGTTIVKTGQSENPLPGLAVSVLGVTLISAKVEGPGSIDASLVNPRKSVRIKKTVK